MSALTRLFARVRDELNELGESIAGSNAQRILDQEIREIDTQLHGWRGEMGMFKAQRLAAQERMEAAVAAIQSREAQALLALQNENAALAHEVAEVIAELEQERDDEQGQLQRLDEHIVQMRRIIAQGERTLRRLKHQLDTVRATESVQRAQAAVASRQSGAANRLPTAIESAQRVRERNEAGAGHDAERAGAEAAAADVAHPDLDAKLRRAGILETDLRAQAVMKRLGERLEPAGKPRRSRTS